MINERPTQEVMFQNAIQRSAQICKTFLAIQDGPNPISREQLIKLIEKRPEIWGRFQSFVSLDVWPWPAKEVQP
jgi:hypothetical protein